MCFSEKLKRQTGLYIRRAYLGTKRRPKGLIILLLQCAFMVLIAWSTYSSMYDPGSPTADYQFNRTIKTYSPLMGPKEDNEGFAQTCMKWRAPKIGLINPVNWDPSQKDYAREIMDTLWNSFNETDERAFFTNQTMTREELDAGQNSLTVDNLKDILCFAIVVDKWDTVNNDYSVSIQYAPAWINWKPVSPVKATNTQYDWSWWKDQTNLAYVRVMAAVADTIIKNNKDGVFKDKNINYELNVLPAVTPEQPAGGNPIMMIIQLKVVAIFAALLISTYDMIMADVNEERIINLSRVMGLEQKSKIAIQVMLGGCSLLFISIPIMTWVKLMYLPYADWSMYIIGTIIMFSPQLAQNIFLITVAGPFLGLLIGMLWPIFWSIFAGVFFAQNPCPPWLASILAFAAPAQVEKFIQMSFLLEGYGSADEPGSRGLQWNRLNWDIEAGYTFLHPFTTMSLTVTVFYGLAVWWAYPIYYIDDGKKRGCCYCLFKDLRTIAVFDESTIPLLSDLAEDQLLMPAEQQLFDQGVLEYPNLQNQLEDDPNYLKSALRLKGLKKSFKNLDKSTVKEMPMRPAVDDLSMSMFKDQIFVLLGHNGAGKTTTISMLTGFGGIHPDEGQVQAFGIDLFKQKNQASQIIGVCPQHDALIFNMTVIENLQWFLGIRGMTDEEIDKYADDMLPKVDMKKKRFDFVGTLSGGQKRKLQLIIALSGNARFILLDEPSSGMDPTARRETWDLIKKEAKGKIILLTTHYMDEAEVLGDRIAVMSKGKLQTCGSSMFLKDRYGLGVLIEVEPLDKSKAQKMDELEDFLKSILNRVDDEDENEEEVQASMKFGRQIRSQSTKKAQEIHGRLDESDLYQIVLPKKLTKHFNEIFTELDNQDNYERFNMKGYNVRVTSLEEVFNKLGEEELAEQLAKEEEKDEPEEDYSDEVLQDFQSRNLSACEQFKVLYGTKIKIQIRNCTLIAAIVSSLATVTLMSLSSISAHPKGVRWATMNIPELYNAYGSNVLNYSLGIPNPDNQQQDYPGNKFSYEDLIYWAPNQLKDPNNSCVMKIEEFKLDTKSNVTANYKDLSMKALEDKKNLIPINESRVEKDLSSYVFMGEQKDTSDGSGITIPIWIGANASQPITSWTTPSIVLQSLMSKVANKNINFNVEFQQPPVQVLFSQAPIPPAALASSCFAFVLVAVATVNSITSSIKADKLSGNEQIIELAGISRSTTIWATFLSEFPKVVFSLVILGVGMDYLIQLNLKGFFIMCIIMIPQQGAYILYYLSKSVDQIKNEGITEAIFSFASYAVPLLLAFVETEVRGSINTFAYAEILLSIHPKITPSLAYMKLMYRARYAGLNGEDYFGVWSNVSVLPEIIGCGISVVFYLVMTLLNEGCCKKKEADNNIATIEADPKLKFQLKNYKGMMNNDPESKNDPIDIDVKAEEDRCLKIMNGQLPKETITAFDLHKFFITNNEKGKPNKDENKPGISVDDGEVTHHKKVLQAVNGTSFSIKNKESFALLGVNGAGKSTTFKMLSLNEVISKGSIRINEHSQDDLYKDQSLLQGKMGYCPQIDVIIPNLTVLETVEFYARIKGVPENYLQKYCIYMANKFELRKFLHTTATYLSGGNKRKLNTLAAMIGNPSVILLDESSAGVDPFARRRLWKTIRDESVNSALIVTTHSMEEAEALSTKMAIQVDGMFKCFGTAQHIKTKFGKGFTVTIKLDVDKIGRINEAVKKRATKDITRLSSMNKQVQGIGDQSSDSELSVSDVRSAKTSTTIKISLDDAIAQIKQWLPLDAPRVAIDCQKEMSQDGLLSGYYVRLRDGLPIDPTNMFEAVLVLNEISLLIQYFQQEIGWTKIIDLTNDLVSFSIDNDMHKTIGQVFTYIESIKMELAIKDYSAMQTSLEQIFNRFAKQDNMEKFNRRIRKSSVHRSNSQVEDEKNY